MSSDSDDFVQFSRRKQDLSCMAERLRERRGKKPVYRDPDEEDEEEEYKPHGGSQKRQRDRNGSDARRSLKTSKTKIDDVSCAVCGGDEDNGILHACDSCSLSCHLDCMTPPRKVPPQGKWTCAECVHPFSNIEKILDCQVRPLNSTNDEEESPEASAVKSAKHYLVKWKDMSYLHCSWHPIDEFEKVFKAFPGIKIKIKKFHQQMDSLNSSEEDWVPIRSEWTTVEKVIACRMNGQVKEYFVKWKELSYEECTWEVEDDISAFGEEIDKFVAIESREKSLAQRKRKGLTSDGRDAKRRRKEFEQYDQTPEFLPGGTLHPYQLEGLNFLRFAWRNETHVILADEMGLGKTVQSIAFLASLNEENASDPHLVVAPLSTLRNWQREFSLWAPHMNVVMYVGSGQARSVIREYEFYFPKKSVQLKKKKGKKKFVSSSNDSLQQRIKFDVLLTSYEMINLDTAVLKKIKWECMIIDEGHRLKNKDSKLFQTLKLLAAKHRVLLTGTPLQNNLEELFMLMHFLDAGKFASVEEFQQEFKDISQEEQVLRLHKMLAPHLLRRVKKDVIKDLPPKKELILRVELSSMQKEYYKSILTRNFEILARRGVSQISLTNVVMQLRKVCAHPYMLEGVEPMNTNPQESFRQLLDASGKLYLLDKMMVKLKDRGHRVLIYSQFKNMLDILEDYLIYKSWSYERIDGSISGVDRQIRIDRFNSPNSTKFCFILSTRAGGLGINLATADTVIIYDSDWNPHADLQAMARAHRLGQTNKVMIFRLVTRGTIDERMMQMTKKKMILEHVVVGRMKNQVLNQEELDDILRYGAQDLFAEENDEASKSRQIHYDDAAIDRLLDRSQVVNEEALPDEEEDSDFLKAFKVANFEYLDEQEAAAARAEEARRQAELSSQQSSAAERAQYWEELLKDKYQEKQVETLSEFGKGKRSRKQVVCAEDDGSDGSVEISSDDEYDIREADWAEAEASGSGRGLSDGGGKRSHGSRKRARVLTVNALDPPPLMEGEGKSFKVLGFTQSQRATFLQILMRFGLGDFDWSDFYPRMRQKTPEEINRYGTLFLTHIAEDLNDSAMFSDGVPKEGLRIQDVLVRLAILHLIRDKVKSSADKPGIPLFRHDIYSKYPPLNTSKYWKEEYDCRLLQAILKHGYGKWHAIAEDHDCGFQEVIKQELQIPVSGTLPFVTANGFASSENKDATIQEEVQHVPLEAQVKSSIAETVEETRLPVDERGAQLNQFIASENDFYQLKDIQRRVVEFIRKRVLLLEKALNTEYHTQSIAEYQEIDSVNEDLEHLPNEADGESPSNQLHPECTLVNLPVTPLISPEELLTHSVDSALNRLEAVRLYNEMCKLTNENEKDFHHTQNGSKSAALKLKKYFRSLNNLADEVQKLLRDQQSSEQNVVTDHSVIQNNNHSDAVNGVKCNGDKECISPTDNANCSNLKPSTCSEISDRDIMGTNSNGFDSVAPIMLGVAIAKENGQEFCENETSTGLLKTNPNVDSSFLPTKEDEENVSLHTTTKEWVDRVIVLDD